MTDRDTKFAGFARLLLQEMVEHRFLSGEDASLHYGGRLETLIAQRAYDLACHVATQTILEAHGDMNKVSDLTQWPTKDELQ